jgi:hypothetical protein
VTAAQEQMALAAVARGLGLQPAPRALGGTRDLKSIISRRRAFRVLRLSFYGAFAFFVATNLIILSLLIDWQGVAESVGLG